MLETGNLKLDAGNWLPVEAQEILKHHWNRCEKQLDKTLHSGGNVTRLADAGSCSGRISGFKVPGVSTGNPLRLPRPFFMGGVHDLYSFYYNYGSPAADSVDPVDPAI